jgi:hypothetical protein
MHPVQVMITVTEEPTGTLVRVDGWLAGDGVAEFVRVLESAGPPVRLSLPDLRGADAAGLSVLRQLADQGTPLEGLSTYVRLMLANPAGSEPVSASPLARSETSVRSTKT